MLTAFSHIVFKKLVVPCPSKGPDVFWLDQNFLEMGQKYKKIPESCVFDEKHLLMTKVPNACNSLALNKWIYGGSQ